MTSPPPPYGLLPFIDSENNRMNTAFWLVKKLNNRFWLDQKLEV